MEEIEKKIKEYERLIRVISQEISETKELTTQLRLLAEKNDYLEALIVLNKTLKRNKYELTRKD